uniref:Homoserine kinase n=1 Tax=Albugo laibachii Nc14 TaxID=890382 RepID=F0WNA0_9STRA|nr:unnamed protein product [Albugo laibachii Nc14]|eukprot:CCA22789.1 unnamed protein product [Albugo laibachii Nc14]
MDAKVWLAQLSIAFGVAYSVHFAKKRIARSRCKHKNGLSPEIPCVPPRKAIASLQNEDSDCAPLQSVTVRVPATTANMGPGFDTIGMALDIWNEIKVEILRDCSENTPQFQLSHEGEGADELPTNDSNLIIVGFRAAYKAVYTPLPSHVRIHSKNLIPFARGLGSSSAGIVGGLIAGLALSGKRLPVRGQEKLLQLASGIEGHPDNVAPAIYGGLQLGIFAENRWYSSRVQIPDGLQCVVFIPDTTGPTSIARAILPGTVARQDAVYNIGRAALLINAFRSGNLDELKYATQDSLHQPQRGESQYPHLYPMVQAALVAGAHCCFLSGAGPTILAITSGRSGDIFTQKLGERQESQVADAMRQTAASMNISGCVVITTPEHNGAGISDFVRS